MKRQFILLGFLLSSLCMFGQGEWYKNVELLYDDPYGFTTAFNGSFKKGLPLEGNPAAGKVYAKFKKNEFDRILKLKGKDILETIPITKDNKTTFSDHFKELADSGIPFIVDIVAELNPYLGYSALLLSLAERSREDRKSTAAVLSGLIAVGGKFETTIAFSEKEAGKWYVNLLTNYNVKVGNENRLYMVSRAVYAVKIE